MALIRSESRSKIGIEWYETEAEALATAEAQKPRVARQLEAGYDFGYMWPGRCTAFDTKDAEGNVTEYAVVTP